MADNTELIHLTYAEALFEFDRLVALESSRPLTIDEQIRKTNLASAHNILDEEAADVWPCDQNNP